jgi:hypothetical protein
MHSTPPAGSGPHRCFLPIDGGHHDLSLVAFVGDTQRSSRLRDLAAGVGGAAEFWTLKDRFDLAWRDTAAVHPLGGIRRVQDHLLGIPLPPPPRGRYRLARVLAPRCSTDPVQRFNTARRAESWRA